MADTTRSLAALQTLLADNVGGDISAQDARDFLVSAYKPQTVNPGGRLTLTTGVPVTTSDVTAATSIYYTPYLHNGIGLYDGTSWTLFTFSELTLALGTLTSDKNYDVFLYDNSGTLTLESLVWTNDTTRATALVMQDGVYCKTGALTRRYLGTFRTTSTTTTEDSCGGATTQVGGKRFLFNAYNRVPRSLYVKDTASSWTYTTDAWRVSNGATAPLNSFSFVLGLSVEKVAATVSTFVYNTTATHISSGVGVDSGTSNSAQTVGTRVSDNSSTTSISNYVGCPGVGYHYLAWLERSVATGTTTWYGVTGVAGQQTGMTGEVFA